MCCHYYHDRLKGLATKEQIKNRCSLGKNQLYTTTSLVLIGEVKYKHTKRGMRITFRNFPGDAIFFAETIYTNSQWTNKPNFEKRMKDGPMMYVAYQPIREGDDRPHRSVL
jgi:hypothetical protein